MANWEEIRQEWETSSVTLKALAEKFGVKEATVRSRKNREKWQRNESATQRKNVATKKRITTNEQTQQPQQNRSGNPNPKSKFPERNSYALKHGMFSRYMPKETLEIMGMIGDGSPESLLWIQIELQFAAIIRAQEIMFVRDRDDLTKELKREKQQNGEKGSSWEEEYELQFAWDKQAQFMNTQTKAIGELRSLINQYIKLPQQNEMHQQRLQLMAEQIAKLAKENTPDTSTEDKLKDYFTALQGAFKDDNSES